MEPCGAELYRATSGEEFTQLDQACFADSGTSLEGPGLAAQGKAVHAQNLIQNLRLGGSAFASRSLVGGAFAAEEQVKP